MPMTARQVFEATLIELSKLQAPSLKLYEFNYLFNKAINQYINKVYNTYDLNQQTTDDLRVLKATAYLKPEKWNASNSATHLETRNASSYLSQAHKSIQSLHGATYEVAMPIDYLHLLNCVCIYYVAKLKDCWDAGSYIEIPATRLTADSWSQIITDIYNRPSPMKPYYYIHNQNNSTNNAVLPTDPISAVSTLGMSNGTDMTGTYKVIENGYTKITFTKAKKVNYKKTDGKSGEKDIEKDTVIYLTQGGVKTTVDGDVVDADDLIAYRTAMNEIDTLAEMIYPDPDKTVSTTTVKEGSNFQRTFKLDTDGDGTPDTNVSLVEKPIALRAGNTSNVRMEIRYGKDDSLFLLVEVQVDYVKAPQFIRLTQEQIDLTEDTSQIMEFPDYVNQEIVNELVNLVMARTADPLLQNHVLISQSIARPTGQLAPQQAQQG